MTAVEDMSLKTQKKMEEKYKQVSKHKVLIIISYRQDQDKRLGKSPKTLIQQDKKYLLKD